jgi:homoprotocatechuate degradation regulator HpaR
MKTEEITRSHPLRRTDRSVPIALLRARETVMIPVREMLQESRISEHKWRVLRVVEECGPIELTRIAEKACLHVSSLTRIMHALDRDGLLERSSPEPHKHESMAVITDAGRELIREHTARSNDIFNRLENQFGADKLETLLDLLDELQQVRL